MHLILDVAFNHCNSDNPIFQDAISNPNSKYRDWFHIYENGNYEYWYGIFRICQYLINQIMNTKNMYMEKME